jgi:outer membrane protein OmpA-like peptidoglycan-associated protein
MRAWSEIKVEIEGHTDASGSEAHNLKLSQQRAESVRDYLVSKGVEASRLVAKGYGESQPIADNDSPEGMAKNRRVELKKVN